MPEIRGVLPWHLPTLGNFEGETLWTGQLQCNGYNITHSLGEDRFIGIGAISTWIILEYLGYHLLGSLQPAFFRCHHHRVFFLCPLRIFASFCVRNSCRVLCAAYQFIRLHESLFFLSPFVLLFLQVLLGLGFATLVAPETDMPCVQVRV